MEFIKSKTKFAGPSAQGVSDPRHHRFVHWISFFVVLVIGFCFLELIRRDIPEAPQGRSRPKLLPPVSVGDTHTPRDMSLKIALVFNQFFFVFRLIVWSKMPPKIDPKTFKNHF